MNNCNPDVAIIIKHFSPFNKGWTCCLSKGRESRTPIHGSEIRCPTIGRYPCAPAYNHHDCRRAIYVLCHNYPFRDCGRESNERLVGFFGDCNMLQYQWLNLLACGTSIIIPPFRPYKRMVWLCTMSILTFRSSFSASLMKASIGLWRTPAS